jgi:4-hydroxy-tetrahydrodipicolinate synthase
MDTTRRAFISAVGAAASAAAMPAAHAANQSLQPAGSRLFVAAVTPCGSNGKFDEGLYRDLMPYFKEHGCDGILVLGSTGEFPSFSVAERKRVAETALKHRSGLQVMVQVGTPNLPETLELLGHAESNGADCVLCIPPFYFKKPSLEGLTDYYSRVLPATKLPVFLYHYPDMSAVPITKALLHNLEHFPNLAGIKDSTGNADSYADYVKEFPKLDIMTGTENNLPAALAAGKGAILVTGNLFPRRAAACFEAARKGGDVGAAYEKMRDANASLRVPGVPGGAALFKFGLTAHSFPESFVRPPYVSLTAEQKDAIRPKLDQVKALG